MIKRLTAALAAGLGGCALAEKPVSAPVTGGACVAALEAQLDRFVADEGLPGAVLLAGGLDGGELAVSAGAFDAQTVVPVASASKIVAVAVIARLVEQGALSFDTTVGEIWPDMETAYAQVTLLELFSHRSGIPPRAVFTVLEAGDVASSAERLLQLEPEFEPRSGFSYGGSSFQVAAAMAERATGEDWTTLFEREVADPLGLEQSVFAHPFRREPAGAVQVAGGLWSSASDLARLMTALNDETDGYLDDFARSALRAGVLGGAARIGVPAMVQPGVEYAAGVWCMPAEAGGCSAVHSAGAFGTIPYLDTQAGAWTVIVTRGDISDIYDTELALIADGLACISHEDLN